MDCYDEVLELFHEKEKTDDYLNYLTDLINKKSKILTELQFKNCLILTLAVCNPKFIDLYFSKGKEIRKIDEMKKKKINKLLKSEFSTLDI